MRKTLAVLAVAALVGGISACGTPGASTEPSNLSASSHGGQADEHAPTAPDGSAEEPTKTTRAATVKMPAVAGTNLRVTVDKLERKGVTDIVPVPVDGHAFVANYANWTIVGQTPAPGKPVAEGDEVTLEVRKAGEAENSICLDGDC